MSADQKGANSTTDGKLPACPPYPVVCQECVEDGCVVINQGGDVQIGYAIWSREHLEQLISQMRKCGENVWPTT